MKTKTQFLLLLISVSFFSCNSIVKNQVAPISNLDTDFPTTEKLDFKPFNKYSILEDGYIIIDDSTLWLIREAESDCGFCYNLHTGEKLSTIASRGRAVNEFTQFEGLDIVGDSVLLYTGANTIKTFAKKDIIDNIPMGDRICSITTAPDSISIRRMIKFPNGTVLATIMPPFHESEKAKINGSSQKSVAVFNNKEANTYETIKYESFDLQKAKGEELPANDLIKCAYADGFVEIKGNDMAVFSVMHQFILYTFDVKSGSVINEKRYTKMQRDKRGLSVATINDRRLGIDFIKTNDKFILCKVHGFFSEEDKVSKLYKEAIFVFDWELNPIKKFDLPESKNGHYAISNDGKSVYSCELNEDGLALYKAGFNI